MFSVVKVRVKEGEMRTQCGNEQLAGVVLQTFNNDAFKDTTLRSISKVSMRTRDLAVFEETSGASF